jgi:putative cell wall-binding protein
VTCALFVAQIPGSASAVVVDESGLLAQGSGVSASPIAGRFLGLSEAGAVAVFESASSTLVASDGNAAGDVFVRRSGATTVEAVSVTPDGRTGNGHSGLPSIDAAGIRVAFDSLASDLSSAPAGGVRNVFVRTLGASAETSMVSVASDGGPADDDSWGARIARNAPSVAFVSLASNLTSAADGPDADAFLRDLVTGRTVPVTRSWTGGPATGGATREVSISADGRYVAFATAASNIVPGDTNGQCDVFVRDMASGVTTAVSVTPAGRVGDLDSSRPCISDDGRFVAFVSKADDLVPGDRNGADDIFVRDLDRGVTERVSRSWSGGDAHGNSTDPSISHDGRYVAFSSMAADIATGDANLRSDVFVADRTVGNISLVSSVETRSADGDSYDPVISPDAQHVGFCSNAAELGAAAAGSPVVAPFRPRAFVRIAGADRYETAAKASEGASSSTVIVASGENWPDALAAAPLAGRAKAPLLLTRTGALPAATRAAIVRLKPSKVIIVGESGAVSAGVAREIGGLTTDVVRIGGVDRYATAAAIAETMTAGGGPRAVLVVTGANYPDAVAASPFAYADQSPVVLARPGSAAVLLPSSTTTATILGGTGAVPTAVEDYLKGRLGLAAVSRIGGVDRYATAAQLVEKRATAASWKNLGFATGEQFADALSGGILVGSRGGAMLLTRPSVVPAVGSTLVRDHGRRIPTVLIFGGTGAVQGNVVETAFGDVRPGL